MPYILMHMRGNPKTMQRLADYTDTCLEVGQELQAQAEAAMAAGIEPWRIILDPGASALRSAIHVSATNVALACTYTVAHSGGLAVWRRLFDMHLH